jgi:4'-phosphopantetheinyl transferase
MNAFTTIDGSEAHVWRIDVDQVPIVDARDLLDPDERSKADRFRFPADRVRYLAAHISLRKILSRYLNIDPAHIHYRASAYGKPFVADHSIEFSLSHSGEVILIAVMRDRRYALRALPHVSVGIDVERIRSDFDFQPVVDRYFSAREKAELFSQPPSAQSQHFFSMWTRKEAVLKMLGQGLSGLDQAEVALENEGKWSVQAIDVGAEYEAAVAVENEAVTVKTFRM